MRIPRFFLYGHDLPAATEALHDFSSGTHAGVRLQIVERDLIHRIVKVLRVRSGDRVVFLDDNRNEYICVLVDQRPQLLSFDVEGRQKSGGELPVAVEIAQALIKGERFDWALEKLTELGAARIVPIITTRSVRVTDNLEPFRTNKKMERWQAIVREAAEQSERGAIPQVVMPMSLFEYMQRSAEGGPEHIRLICAERSQARSISDFLKSNSARLVSAVVGPEGGFTDEEMALAKSKGWSEISLGSRILRSETAGMSVMAQLASLLAPQPD